MYTYPMDCKIHNASFVKYTILSIIRSNIHEVIMLNVSKYWACNIVPNNESHVCSTSRVQINGFLSLFTKYM